MTVGGATEPTPGRVSPFAHISPTMKTDPSFKLVSAIVLAGVVVAFISAVQPVVEPATPVSAVQTVTAGR